MLFSNIRAFINSLSLHEIIKIQQSHIDEHYNLYIIKD